ncbi:MAG: response regulator [Thermoanaerobaculia bacterium]
MDKETILLVEHDPLITRAVEQAGRQFHVTCDCATDGWDAIERLEDRRDYAAILIDADVPNHSGYGVLTYLREEVGGELANVVLMTGSDRDEVRRKAGPRLRVIRKEDAAAEVERVAASAFAPQPL